MKTAPIILICGNAGSGKDTVAKMLAEKLGGGHAVTISHAEPFKQYFEKFAAIPKEVLYGPSELRSTIYPKFVTYEFWEHLALATRSEAGKKFFRDLSIDPDLGNFWVRMHRNHTMIMAEKSAPSIRELLQSFGEFFRENNKNVWSNACLSRAQDLLNEKDFVVITDGRRRNEIVNAKTKNVFAVLVVDPNAGQAMTHVSEQELLGIPDSWYNHVLVNPKQLGLKWLSGEVEQIAKDFKS